ncbi:trypco2 family protein [Streptomyces sp. SS]|uniref:trypco2 family protein n=1 Tax=Streptomyces sp. SS TaxID=260742 RepID=UPI00031B7545|nr:trypco2 family protein [Streptomyces sp. SS]
MSTIGLAAAIEELRQELYEAQRQGVGQQFAFGVEEAELELQLELRHSQKGDGKLSFGVVTVGGGAERASVRTHTLRIRLSVADKAAGGTRPEVNDDETGSWDDGE